MPLEALIFDVDGTLAGEDSQIVADHLASCELCAAAVDDLNAFQVQHHFAGS